MASHFQVGRTRILKKLNRLYGGSLAIPKPSDSFVNLSSVVLSDAQGILFPRLREASQQLRDNEHIIIRKANKSNTIVILDFFLDKRNNLLGDLSKFKPLSGNPTVKLKSKVNSLIHAANAVIGDLEFNSITGDFAPSYFYGNVKSHKESNPLRPIISQISIITYSLAKRLNQIPTPYIPTTHSLKSTDEFVDILKCNKHTGILASLNAESLFSHVPLIRIIDIILNFTYCNPVLKDMLLACTSGAPFKCPLDNLYIQTDGVAMGSPLGVLFAQAIMVHVEEEVISNLPIKPTLYRSYIDYIFGCVNDLCLLEKDRSNLQEVSGLKISVELNNNNKLPFLDVLVDTSSNDFITSVYHKPTITGKCMNGESECMVENKRGVIKAYVRRAFKAEEVARLNGCEGGRRLQEANNSNRLGLPCHWIKLMACQVYVCFTVYAT
ncbi:uncharacterized protein LOC143019880 [Oratosquilla oratoria]|uniref:uncharacterized protein LOC143019880 n=1 Tax=Oratosquilla oratoria TaxID=337810 RepID=UPI003F77121E